MKFSLSPRLLMLLTLIALGACSTTDSEVQTWPLEERTKAHVDLGWNYLQRDSLDFARESFEKALEVNRNSAKAYHGLGLVEAKSLNLSLARNYLARSIKLDNTDISAMSDYAVVLCQSGSPREGVELLERYIKEPQKAGVGTILAFGRCYEANHQNEKAKIAYVGVLKQEPNLPQALLSMANLKYADKNYLSSSAFLQRYFYTKTVSSEALLLAAQVEDRLDNAKERDSYTQKLWTRYPRSEQASKARELFGQ